MVTATTIIAMICSIVSTLSLGNVYGVVSQFAVIPMMTMDVIAWIMMKRWSSSYTTTEEWECSLKEEQQRYRRQWMVTHYVLWSSFFIQSVLSTIDLVSRSNDNLSISSSNRFHIVFVHSMVDGMVIVIMSIFKWKHQRSKSESALFPVFSTQFRCHSPAKDDDVASTERLRKAMSDNFGEMDSDTNSEFMRIFDGWSVENLSFFMERFKETQDPQSTTIHILHSLEKPEESI